MLLNSLGKKIKTVSDSTEIDDLVVTLEFSNKITCGKNILGTPHYIPLLNVIMPRDMMSENRRTDDSL